jgi:cytidylate kinase
MARPDIGAILERQARAWERKRTLVEADSKAARERLAHLREGPWLSISRQWGSGGLEVAREAGRRLGWEVYDREILAAIAEQTHTREAVLADLEKGAVGPFRDYISQLIVPGDPGRVTYLVELAKLVWGLARKGHVVLVGRGVNWYLDARYGLRVRIVAPLDHRVARLAAAEGTPEADARRKLLQIDHDRKAFVQQAFGRDINDPLGYDLVLNVERLTVEAAARIIGDALHAKLGPTA